jgi:hypothetical protein
MQSNKTVIHGDNITIYGDKWIAFNDDNFQQRAFFSIKSVAMFEKNDDNILHFRMKYDSNLYYKFVTEKDYKLFLAALKIGGDE